MDRSYGQGRVFQRRKKWWIAYYAPVHGRATEVRESGGDLEKDARALLASRLLEVAAHKRGLTTFHAGREKVTLAALVGEVLEDMALRKKTSARTDVSHAKRLDEYFGTTRAVTITEATIAAYVVWRRGAGAADKTIDHELALMRRAFRRPGAPPSPRIPLLVSKHANARRGFLTEKQFRALLRALPPGETDLRDLIEWFWWTGMRPAEIARLTWEDVDGDVLRLAAADAKTGRARLIPLVGPLAAIIKRRRAVQDGALIFHVKGRRAAAKYAGWQKREMAIWHAACRAAGLEGTIPYDLRRCAIRNLRAAGVPERVAMEISGHRSRATFDRYGIVDETDLREAFARVTRFKTRTQTRTRSHVSA
jgi:integrase